MDRESGGLIRKTIRSPTMEAGYVTLCAASPEVNATVFQEATNLLPLDPLPQPTVPVSTVSTITGGSTRAFIGAMAGMADMAGMPVVGHSKGVIHYVTGEKSDQWPTARHKSISCVVSGGGVGVTRGAIISSDADYMLAVNNEEKNKGIMLENSDVRLA